MNATADTGFLVAFANARVLTVDRADFAVYRRNKRESIPLCTPAG